MDFEIMVLIFVHAHRTKTFDVYDLFKQHVCDLCSTISSMGNPFLDDCTELLLLNTRNCASEEVFKTVKNINDIGLSQYKAYVRDVVESRKTPIHQPIKRNSLPLFKRQKKRVRNSSVTLRVILIRSVTCTLQVPFEVEI